MKKRVLLIGFAVLLMSVAGCDLLDPTNVENPEITEETALNNPRPLAPWVEGLERQHALVLNNFLEIAELGTDNYENTQTFYNQSFDGLTINYQDSDIENAFFTQNDLRESALFGKNTVALADEGATPEELAELDFFLGLSHLYLGEFFRAAPLEANGAPATPNDHFQQAVTAFQDAIDSGVGNQTSYKLALARTYYNLGDRAQATALAQDVLSADDEFVRFAEFDNQNQSAADNNRLQDALYDRGTFDDFQPLPRLDFLDPKYRLIGPSTESPIPYLKAEEAHLILIEAALADNNLPAAQNQMKELIALVESRPVDTFDDSVENRTQEAPGSRPDTSSVVVRASADDPFRSGLVLDRDEEDGNGNPVPVSVSVVSGTSVTDAMVDNVADAQEAWELYYLMRQEIFLAEGRRFVDFGIKLPLPEPEEVQNENVQADSDAVTAVVPSYIDGQPMDEFTYDAEAGEATITVNMNRVLANNRSEVSPFLQ